MHADVPVTTGNRIGSRVGGGAVLARGGMGTGCVWLGFWRLWLGERSPKMAIARDSPPKHALAVVGGWNGGAGGGFAPAAEGEAELGEELDRVVVVHLLEDVVGQGEAAHHGLLGFGDVGVEDGAG